MNGLCPEADKLYLALNQARGAQAEFAALMRLINHRLACEDKHCRMTDEQARQAVQAAMGVKA